MVQSDQQEREVLGTRGTRSRRLHMVVIFPQRHRGIEVRNIDRGATVPSSTGMAEAATEPVPGGFFRTALRRAIAVVSAVAFLAVGFVHFAQHDGLLGSTETTWQSVSAPSDDAPDSTKHAALGEHCHGCTMVAVEVTGDQVSPPRIQAAHEAPAPAGFRPHPPATDSPPPKFLI